MERDKRKKSKMPCLFGGNGENLNRKTLQPRSSPSDGFTEHNLFGFEVGQTSSKQGYGTPMKTLLAKEMLNEASAKKRSPSLIAKLMGLDGLPSPQPIHRQQRKLSDNSHNKRNENPLGHQLHKKTTIEQQQFKDVYEDPEASHAGNQRYSSPLNSKRRSTKQDLGYIQERCDEMLRESIAIKTKLERVDSNSDLMLTFLQKPDSLYVKHLHDHQSIPSNSLCNQITVLKPSNSFRKEEKETLHYRHRRSSRILERKDDIALSPTRIVVLKPNLAKIHNDKSSAHVRSPETYKGPLSEVRSSRHKSKEAREIARQITSQMKEGFECGDINLFHSGFRRYDDMDEFDRPRRSPMSESSVIKEAKKRMSQRWKTHGYKDPGMVGKGSFSTLEEMLSVPNSEMRHDDIINVEYHRSTSRSRSVPPSFHNQSHGDLKLVVHNEPVYRNKNKGVKGNFNRREDSRSKNLRYAKRCNACSPELDDYLPEHHSARKPTEQESLVSNIHDPPITVDSSAVDEDSLISQEQWGAKSGGTVSIQLSGPEPESSEGSKEVDQCGEISLEVSPIEDVSSGSDCFEGVSSRLHELRKQLHLLKMESESTYESQNEEEVDQESSYTVPSSENWESAYLTDFLQGCGFFDNDPYTFMSTWYNSVDSPTNPWLFDHMEKKYAEGSTVSRSERRMFYDRISEALSVISKTGVSCSWVSPKERGIQMTLTEIGFEDQLQRLLGKQEKEAMEDFEETWIDRDLEWVHPVDEIDVVGNRIAEMLVNDLVLEIVTL